jgi:hypothetical protein
MKYELIDGTIREFRGRIFMRGMPLDITDVGTLEAISHSPYFRKVEDEKEQRQETAQEVLNRPVLSLRKRK